jgi:hypothetical protein
MHKFIGGGRWFPTVHPCNKIISEAFEQRIEEE